MPAGRAPRDGAALQLAWWTRAVGCPGELHPPKAAVRRRRLCCGLARSLLRLANAVSNELGVHGRDNPVRTSNRRWWCDNRCLRTERTDGALAPHTSQTGESSLPKSKRINNESQCD